MRLESARSLRERVGDGYDRLGCLATLSLFALVVIGLLITTHAADTTVICMEYGTKTYFHDGVRHVPHGGFFRLTNGREISNIFRLVFTVIWASSFVLWIAVAVLFVVAVNELFGMRLAPKASADISPRSGDA